MGAVYVIDTDSFISYFCDVFGVRSLLSPRATQLINRALTASETDIRLSIPSVVFLEVFEKWFTTREFVAKFHYEVLEPVNRSPNIEIKSIDQEVLENLVKIRGSLSRHDLHDKIILASAMMLHCPLITTDSKIIAYNDDSHVVPTIIN